MSRGVAGIVQGADLGAFDEKGFLRIVGRKKEMVMVSGFSVHLNEAGGRRGAAWTFVRAALRDLSTAVFVARDERSTQWASRARIVTRPVS